MQVVGHRKRRGGLAQWACDPHCQANVLAAPRDRSLQTGQGTVLDSSGQPCGPIVSPTVLAPAVPRLCPLWPVPALRSSAKRGQRERRGRKGAEEGSFVLSAPVCQSGRSGLPVTCRSSRLSDRSPKKQLSGGLPCFPDPGRQALLHGLFFTDSFRIRAGQINPARLRQSLFPKRPTTWYSLTRMSRVLVIFAGLVPNGHFACLLLLKPTERTRIRDGGSCWPKGSAESHFLVLGENPPS